jgi:hypothetical protein
MSNLPTNATSLSDCGCCEGQQARTPMELYNRPGLSVIAYRVGDYGDFRAGMQARLSASDQAALAGLRTRDDDDFSIALLDAWAVVSDVLTFYQERYINESYLRTATERLSVLEQARLIGYELSPGVAASTYLAFTLEDPPGAPDKAVKQITIETGVKVQSTPGPGEYPQTYETVEQVEARVEWNEIRPRLQQPQQLGSGMSRIVFDGTDTGVKKGDTLLIKTGSMTTKRISQVTTDDDADTTRVDFDGTPALSPSSYSTSCDPATAGSMDDLISELAATLAATIKNIIEDCWKVEDIVALAELQNWDLDTVVENINTLIAFDEASSPEGVYAFRQQAAVFGNNVPKKQLYDSDGSPLVNSSGELITREWSTSGETEDTLYLDNSYKEIVPGSYVVITRPFDHPAHGSSPYIPTEVIASVTSVATQPHTEYGISGKTTELQLDTPWIMPGHFGFDLVRLTNVLAQSEQLTVGQVPIEDEVQGDSLTLDGAYLYLRAGQNVILTGERTDLEGISASEVVTLKEVLLDHGFTVLVFENDLKYTYTRESVSVNANVAMASHGETVSELLGSGDAGQANQKFVLKQTPLTYVSASTPSGVKSTLQIRVDDILWDEVPSLYGRDADEHIYTTHLDDDGKVTVLFGDGINGARLTSGQNNVRATYRKGIGLGGLVKAKQIDQLITRPLGLKSAVNPLAPAGADDPEKLADARDNAPLTVLTLDRAVSLQDYEDFSRAFAGIAKAFAIESWDGGKKRILITVAGPEGASVEVGGKLHGDLSDALQKAGDPLVDFRVLSYRSAPFRLDGNITVDAAYVEEDVLDDVKSALREKFSFEVRQFGRPVHLSDVYAVIQAVAGVIAVDIDRLYRTDETESIPTDMRLNAALPEKDSFTGERLGAEMLVLDAAPLTDLGVKS